MYLEVREMCFKYGLQSAGRLVSKEKDDALLPGGMVTPRERENWQDSISFGGHPWLWR